ncbi:MAG: hypothetical protein IJW92_08250 [Clostridia bacterium]|nr:hypothetical protein [Clostridia bacterium]
MKKALIWLFLAATLLLCFSSCATESYDLLYSTEQNGITFCARGSGTRLRQIVIKKGDAIIWSKQVHVDEAVGNLNGTYGFAVTDLNFDGHPDFTVAESVDGECATYRCWLYNTVRDSYIESEELSGLCNVQADEELQAVFSFSHTYEAEAYGEASAAYSECDRATKYVWENGELIPEMYVSITYYSEAKRYCYEVASYDRTLGKFIESGDKWLTPEEYEKTDMSFLYYYRD